MARALLICRRHGDVSDGAAVVSAINARLTPDNLRVVPPRYACENGVVSAVLRPHGAAAMHGLGIRLGAVERTAKDWWSPGAAVPDGCFALLRADAEAIELVADSTASRTIWYAMTDDAFIASTSQRAIVMCLASFRANRTAVSWMISSASLGPDIGWDARLACVPPGGRVRLDRRAWRMQRSTPPVRFDAEPVSPRTHRERLEHAVLESVRHLDHEPSQWLLPLSGGIDSRGLLLAYLHAGVAPAQLRCVTWGRRAALDAADSDAAVARRLADHFGLEHRYFETDVSTDDDHDTVIQRFLVAGEGRVAHIAGYLDGFALWKRLHDEDCAGVLRGDEGFGAYPVRHAVHARASIGLTTLSDYFDEAAVRAFELPDQPLPDDLRRGPHESLVAWRDRARHRFRLPCVLAGLTDLKTAYVEVLNPLLSRRVIECIRALPAALRTDKRIWKERVDAWSPRIPYARESAVVSMREYLSDPALLALMHQELDADDAEAALGAACRGLLRGDVEAALSAGPRPRVAHGRLGRVGKKLQSAAFKLRGVLPPPDPLALAFRGVLVARMHALLAADAGVLASAGSAAAAARGERLAQSNG